MFDVSSYFPVYLLAFIDMDLTTAMHSIKALGSKVFPKEASTGGRSSFAENVLIAKFIERMATHI